MRRTAKSCAERQAASSRSKVPMWPGFHSGEQAAPDQTLHRNESVRCHAQFKEFVSDKQPQRLHHKQQKHAPALQPKRDFIDINDSIEYIAIVGRRFP
jgi:hypothetical protein